MAANTPQSRPGPDEVLRVSRLSLRYRNGTQALSDVSLTARHGELVAVLGSNGSGKSSLLRCITRLIEPTAGQITVAGRDVTQLRGAALRYGRMHLGMISQSAHLVRRRSVVANVMAGTLARHHEVRTAFGGTPRSERQLALECLNHVGLQALAEQRAGTLSGGQAQRVAIARALAQQPKLVLADEPVASLDPEAAGEVMHLLRHLTDQGLAVICVLHQPELARRFADRVIGLMGGRFVFETGAETVSHSDIEQLYAKRAA